jgi:predicted nuclease with TOPRIM domain
VAVVLEVIATLTGILFGAIGTLIGVRSYIQNIRQNWQQRLQAEINKQADSKLKAYAAERDFNHLRNNQEQMKEAVSGLQEESEELRHVLIELKTLQTAMNNRLEMLTARVEGESTSGWARRSRDGG